MVLSVQGLRFVPEIPKQEGLVPAPEGDNVKDVNKGQEALPEAGAIILAA